MSHRKDDLDIFDELEPQNKQTPTFRGLNEQTESRIPRRKKPVILALILILLLALGIWRFTQWQNSRATESDTPMPVETSAEAPQPTSETTPTYLNGEHPQAVEGRPAADPTAVEIPPAQMPEVDTKDAESVMRGFITITNSRDSAEEADFERVKEWAAPYSAIEDMSGFDAYGNDTADILPAPVTVEGIEVKDRLETQPKNTSIRESRLLETTVLASTGQKLRLEWQVTAMMDESENWVITEAALESWQGISS